MENDCFIRYKDGQCFKGREGIGLDFKGHRYIDPMCMLSLLGSEDPYYLGQNIDYIETPFVKIIFKKQYKDEKDD